MLDNSMYDQNWHDYFRVQASRDFLRNRECIAYPLAKNLFRDELRDLLPLRLINLNHLFIIKHIIKDTSGVGPRG